MQSYFVRIASNHEVVGIFVADSIATLCRLVDECTNVPGCEYLPAGIGGLFIEGKTAAQLPARFDGEEVHPDDEDPFRGAVIGELWSNVLASKKRWKTLSWPET